MMKMIIYDPITFFHTISRQQQFQSESVHQLVFQVETNEELGKHYEEENSMKNMIINGKCISVEWRGGLEDTRSAPVFVETATGFMVRQMNYNFIANNLW